jgi:hypothetical protein
MKTSAVFLILFIWIISIVVFSSAVKNLYNDEKPIEGWQAKVVRGVASFPNLAPQALQELTYHFNADPIPLLQDRSSNDRNSWQQSFPCEQDDGYLLLSGVDPSRRSANIRLISINDGNIIKEWSPDWVRISEKIKQQLGGKFKISRAMAGHPLPLPSGDILINVQKATILIDSGTGTDFKIFPIESHHSLEMGENSHYIVTSGFSGGCFADNKFLAKRIIDDTICTFSLDGKLISNKSFACILIENGLGSLVFGHSGTRVISKDLVHLNQITVAEHDGMNWKRGDFLISARHLSAIFLYRPSENKIIWYQSGPWKNQHSAHFVSESKIALFDNNVFGFKPDAPEEENFVGKEDINQIFVIDFSFSPPKISEPYKHLLKEKIIRPKTVTEGRLRVLKDGGVFIEDTNNGRHIRFSTTNLMWSRVNYYNDKYIGRVNWSRYLSKAEGQIFHAAIRTAESKLNSSKKDGAINK